MKYGFITLKSIKGVEHTSSIDHIIDIKHKENNVYRIFFINPMLDYDIDESEYKKIREIIENM